MSDQLCTLPCPEPYCESGLIIQDDGSSRECRTCSGRGEIENDLDANWFTVSDCPVYKTDNRVEIEIIKPERWSEWVGPTIAELITMETKSQ